MGAKRRALSKDITTVNSFNFVLYHAILYLCVLAAKKIKIRIGKLTATSTAIRAAEKTTRTFDFIYTIRDEDRV